MSRAIQKARQTTMTSHRSPNLVAQLRMKPSLPVLSLSEDITIRLPHKPRPLGVTSMQRKRLEQSRLWPILGRAGETACRHSQKRLQTQPSRQEPLCNCCFQQLPAE